MFSATITEEERYLSSDDSFNTTYSQSSVYESFLTLENRQTNVINGNLNYALGDSYISNLTIENRLLTFTDYEYSFVMDSNNYVGIIEDYSAVLVKEVNYTTYFVGKLLKGLVYPKFKQLYRKNPTGISFPRNLSLVIIK